MNLMVLFCLLILITTDAASRKMTFAFIVDPNTNIHAKWTELIYIEAFSRLNIDFEYVILPAIRASRMSDLGRVDGEGGRVVNYDAEHINLIRIAEPIFVSSIRAYTHNSSIEIHSWNDIKNSQYKIEYYRGSHLIHDRLTQYVTPDRLSHSSSPSESLRKLLRGRIDIYIETEQLLAELLTAPEFVGANIKILNQLEDTSIYGYLHKNHHELAPKLAQVFRRMKAEGIFDQYFIKAKQLIGTHEE
ncbi:transporter substrate-binding domain-containing protein [Shewanella sp. VB17]|uniref:substrate-binding periplasmic protein n=1 Tax=Shewanella sp. VB17 TaxID=2739432 RepID=UPI0015663132|nr:transporter substrate-binding domain-containing protein [Shewanella sp. VB17]NRD74271.1 transporter substrate-binding domain-containing protein [Shewanella sp. VB17]